MLLNRRVWLCTLVLYFSLVALCMVLVWGSMKLNDGRWVYPLDDTYIHMSIAKNFSEFGIWGATFHGFSNCSSAPGFTLGLSLLYKIVGANEFNPLYFNLVAGFLACLLLVTFFFRMGFNTVWCLLTAGFFILFVPLSGMVVMGMEHALHITWAIAFVWLSYEYLIKGRQFGLLLFVSFIGTAIRYESLFPVAALCFLLLLQKQWWQVLALAASAWVFPILFGLYSMTQGWYFFPNSILMKVGLLQPLSFWPFGKNPFTFLWRLHSVPEAYILIFLIAAGLYLSKSTSEKNWYLLPLICTILHMNFAKTGTAYRYEAYLIATLSLTAIYVLHQYLAIWLNQFKGRWLFLLVPLVLLCSPIFTRAVKSQTIMIKASHNIYSQQIQMARFAARFYQGEAIALNDIGAVSYFADPELTDFAGLADLESSRFIKSGLATDSKWMAGIADQRKAQLIMIYDSWFYGQIPDQWIKVAEHRLEYNFICGDDEVSFYAINQEAADVLKKRLKAFAPGLKGSGVLVFSP